MELALLEAWERGRIPLPVITVDFKDCALPKPLRVTSLEAPHRIADAILRDSLLGGKPFRKSPLGKRLDDVSIRDATTLFEVCPTALVLGMWDSTGPRGGLGAKFARSLVSEIVGLHAESGRKPSSRIDPLQIVKRAGPVFRDEEGNMTVFEEEAKKLKGKPVLFGRDSKGNDVPYEKGKDQEQGKPSAANHGNVTPSLRDPKTKQDLPGGVTISRAVQTTVLSLPALRRLRFPLNGEQRSQTEVDDAARVALAALGLCAAVLNQERGRDLRSRCQLHPTTALVWELLDEPGQPPRRFTLKTDGAVDLYRDAVDRARKAGLPWMEKELVLQPSPSLAALVRKSQELAASQLAEAEEGNQ
jgi:CRISPR-associated protein Csb1